MWQQTKSSNVEKDNVSHQVGFILEMQANQSIDPNQSM
jgi:hypothetical protein